MGFDPRTIGTPVYEALSNLRSPYDSALTDPQIRLNPSTHRSHLQEQKSQAVELYTYLSTWGLMRLRAEEISLNKWNSSNPSIQKRAETSQEGKREVIESYFSCLEAIAKIPNLANGQGLNNLKKMATEDYLGLTGLGLAVAQEFSFWATAVYSDISGGE